MIEGVLWACHVNIAHAPPPSTRYRAAHGGIFVSSGTGLLALAEITSLALPWYYPTLPFAS